MNDSLQHLAMTAALIMGALAAGCRSQVASPVCDQAEAGVDPCADRLHDLCGQLLLHYAGCGDLPERLADLNKDGGFPVPLVCPRTGRPYQYDRDGLRVPDRAGRLIVFDGRPCRPGRRWGILREPAQPGQPLILKVITVPEGAFAVPARPPSEE